MTPSTVVLVHGLWMTPRCWESFRGLYETAGYRVLTPPWPGLKGEVEDVRREPSGLAGIGVMEIANHCDAFVRGLDEAPILMGHSFGGLIVQLLLDRGLGAAGVAIDSAPPKGILRLPWSTIKASSPVLSNPANFYRTVALSFEQFCYGFANVMPEQLAREAYERHAIPGPGRPIFQAALANFNPWAVTKVNYLNPNRAPLLLIAGAEDHQVPASVNRDNYRKYARSKSVTAFKEFPGRSHFIIGQTGWEEVAGYALSWANAQTAMDAR
jgi:pimeloyl-ACP methyl ester carboxylesterase